MNHGPPSISSWVRLPLGSICGFICAWRRTTSRLSARYLSSKSRGSFGLRANVACSNSPPFLSIVRIRSSGTRQVSRLLTLRSDPRLFKTHPSYQSPIMPLQMLHGPQKLYPPRAGLPASSRFIHLSRIYAPQAHLPYMRSLSRSGLLEPRIETTLQIVSILICSAAPFPACRASRFADPRNVATALLTLPSAHANYVVQVEAC